ncbi:MAG TPA: IS701 family transposase [Ktedonobacteraceae bacterium]|nr:IS701 family transposase [Ktedonobacteraceae bacterium]
MKPSHDTILSPILASEIVRWQEQLRLLHQRLRPSFARPEPFQRALRFLQALLSEVPRKNGWQVAEHAREATPYGMQRLLAEAVWDENSVRDEVRRLAVETLGRENVILALDETSFPKRGEHSAGVARQYCGSTGRVENCQVGVFLSWITARGHTLIDRELYLPTCWTDDRQRCQKAGIPASIPFRTKPELAIQMLMRVREAHLHADWVVADTVYGGNAALREWLEEQGQAYVGMVPCTEPIVLTLPDGTLRRIEVGDLPALLPEELSWSRLAASTGPKGPLLFDWLCLPLWHRGREDGQHFVLLRRFLEEPNRITFALVFAPSPTPLTRLIVVAGSRWSIEEDFANGKHLGMDHYEVRCYHGWYRSLTLILLILVYLTSLRIQQGDAKERSSVREIHHLLARLLFVLPSGFSLVAAWFAPAPVAWQGGCHLPSASSPQSRLALL